MCKNIFVHRRRMRSVAAAREAAVVDHDRMLIRRIFAGARKEGA